MRLTNMEPTDALLEQPGLLNSKQTSPSQV